MKQIKDKDNFLFKKDIFDDEKFKEIFNIYEKMFIRRGLWGKDYFDSQVWFLKHDQYFNPSNKTKESFLERTGQMNKDNSNNSSNRQHSKANSVTVPDTTPNKPNPICEIIKLCNEMPSPNDEENNNFTNSTNFTNLNMNKNKVAIKVNVEKFIYKVIESLLQSSKIIQRSEETIKMYKAHQKVNVINESLKILQDRINKHVGDCNYTSKFKLGLSKLENFPMGEYEFELKVVEFNPSAGENSNCNNETLSSSNNSSMIITKNFKVEETVKVNEDSEIISLNTAKYSFGDYEFKLFDNKVLESLAKNYSHSGTTFSNFKLKCLRKNNNEKLEGKTEFFLDLVLIYTEDLYEISKDNIIKNLHFKLAPATWNKSQSQSISNNKGSSLSDFDCDVTVEMDLEMDDLTRSGILKRVCEIFNGVIKTKRANEDIIDDLLDEYFPEEAELVKAALFKKGEMRRDNCCSGCSIL